MDTFLTCFYPCSWISCFYYAAEYFIKFLKAATVTIALVLLFLLPKSFAFKGIFHAELLLLDFELSLSSLKACIDDSSLLPSIGSTYIWRLLELLSLHSNSYISTSSFFSYIAYLKVTVRLICAWNLSSTSSSDLTRLSSLIVLCLSLMKWYSCLVTLDLMRLLRILNCL